jgi:translocator protein
MEPATELRARTSSVLILTVLACVILGFLPALATEPRGYRELISGVLWAPAPEVFAPMALAVYALLGLAAWLVWKPDPGAQLGGWGGGSEARELDEVKRRRALGWFTAQAILGALWIPALLGFGAIGVAVAILAGAAIAIVGTMILFAQRSWFAAALLVPHLVWVGFAGSLAIAFWALYL